jgi:hypothetical protein
LPRPRDLFICAKDLFVGASDPGFIVILSGNVLDNPIEYLDDEMPSDNFATDLFLNCFEPYFEEVTVTEAFLPGVCFLAIFII